MDVFLNDISDIYNMKPGEIITVDAPLPDIYYESMVNNKIVSVDTHFMFDKYKQVTYLTKPSQKQIATMLVGCHLCQMFHDNEESFAYVNLVGDKRFGESSFRAAVYNAMKSLDVGGKPKLMMKDRQIMLRITNTNDFDLKIRLEPILSRREKTVSMIIPVDINRVSIRRKVYFIAKNHGLRLKTNMQGSKLTVTVVGENKTNAPSQATVLRKENYAGRFDAWLNQLPYDEPTSVPDIGGINVSEKGHAYIAALCSRRKEGNFKVSKGVVTRRSVCLSKDKEDGKVCLTINGERVYKCNTRSVTGITSKEHAEMHRILAERGLSGREYR